MGSGLAAASASARAAARADRTLVVVAAAVLGGLLVRVAWVVVAARRPVDLVDPARYVGYAEAIARGQGMVEPFTGQPTAYFPPGYPWFLGAIQAVLVRTPLPDDLPLVAGLVQAGLGAAGIVAVAVLARRLHSPAAGAVAAVGMAVYPNLVLHTAALLSETLAVALLLGLLVALVPPPGVDPWPAGLGRRRLAGAGLLFGGLLLVRPVSAGVVVALAVSLLVAGAGWRRSAAAVGVVVVVGLACVVPWTVRNAVRMDAFVPISTNTGDNLCMGHGPGATGGFRLGHDECATGTGVQDGTAGEVRNDARARRAALDGIRVAWRREPWLAWKRLQFTFERDDDAVRAVQSYERDPWLGARRKLLLERASAGAWLVVALAGVVGMARLARGPRGPAEGPADQVGPVAVPPGGAGPSRRAVATVAHRPRPAVRGDRLLVPLTALSLVAVPLLTFGDPRFKVPLVPLLILAAAVAVTRPASEGPVAGGAHRDG